jgi:hypothetical protein
LLWVELLVFVALEFAVEPLDWVTPPAAQELWQSDGGPAFSTATFGDSFTAVELALADCSIEFVAFCVCSIVWPGSGTERLANAGPAATASAPARATASTNRLRFMVDLPFEIGLHLLPARGAIAAGLLRAGPRLAGAFDPESERRWNGEVRHGSEPTTQPRRHERES